MTFDLEILCNRIIGPQDDLTAFSLLKLYNSLRPLLYNGETRVDSDDPNTTTQKIVWYNATSLQRLFYLQAEMLFATFIIPCVSLYIILLTVVKWMKRLSRTGSDPSVAVARPLCGPIPLQISRSRLPDPRSPA